MIAPEAGDRVLMLAIADVGELRRIAQAVTRGLLVGLGTADEVHAARRALADLDNVMFVIREGTDIPWRDGFFTLIVAPDLEQATGEMRRVAAPGASVLLRGGAVDRAPGVSMTEDH